MRYARLTYEGAFHHAMNRGYDGIEIFKSTKCKEKFIELLRDKSELFKIVIYSYCVLDNHYHLVLCNQSGKMGSFFQSIDGIFAGFFRKNYGGRGYVFQDRYNSTLIQNENYLMMSLIYCLLNPVRANIVHCPFEYKWSSINQYYSDAKSRKKRIVNTTFVEDLFKDKSVLITDLENWGKKSLPIKSIKNREILGDDLFKKRIENDINLIDLRKYEEVFFDFINPDEIVQQFQKEFNVKMEFLNYVAMSNKRLRSKLLVRLKDHGGLTYPEIKDLKIFKDLKLTSLNNIYKREKKRNVQ